MPIGPNRFSAHGSRSPHYLRRSKQAPVFLPGALGAQKAAQARTVPAVPSTVPPPPPIDGIRCAIDYLIFHLRDRLMQMFLNIQLAARRPSHVDPPLTAICFDRHVGTGTVASGDPPIAAPVGVTTLILDFTVPQKYRGILNVWGVDCLQGPVAALDLGWQVTVNGRPVPPFEPTFGVQPLAAATANFWAGPRFTILTPGPLCVHLKSGDQVRLNVRNLGIDPTLTVAARMGGWVYQPTVDEAGLQVRTTMTDQQ